MSFSFNLAKPAEGAPNFGFGSPAGDSKGANAGKPFGTPTTQANAFKVPTPGQPAFWAPQFGTTTSQQAFGTPTGQQAFGAPAGQQTFGATPTGHAMFATPTGTQNAFGMVPAKPATPSFPLGAAATPTTVSLSFGASTTPTGFGFGAPKPATTTTTNTGFSLGTAPSTGFGVPVTGTTPAFGVPATGTAPAFGVPATGTAPAFGVPATGTAPAFGAPATGTAPAFGVPATSTAPAFGATVAPTLGGFGSTPVAASTGFGGFGATATSTAVPGFGLPVATTTNPTFNLSSTTPATAVSTGFSAGVGSSVAPSFSLGATPAYTAPVSGFSLGGITPVTSAISTASSLGSTLGGTPAKTTTGFSFGGTTTATTVTPFSLGTATTAVTALTATTISSALPAAGTLTFGQLEDAINKWTIELEEQSKLYSNQARQLNAWDRLLITNGEKVMSLSNGVERMKQQQQELDQELDFVVAQQKELEDLIRPLEKELDVAAVTDVDRGNTYQLAENIDTQLKQMTEDLKEIIEQLNESNKAQEMSNPITQIGKILNAHMNSLQWIDHNTTKITTHLDQISKMNDLKRKSHEMSIHRNYD